MTGEDPAGPSAPPPASKFSVRSIHQDACPLRELLRELARTLIEDSLSPFARGACFMAAMSSASMSSRICSGVWSMLTLPS
jgi:hypothetical protein